MTVQAIFDDLETRLGDWMSRLSMGTSWAAAMALAVGMTSSVSAADLGGNCCADLEERIAELEATTARKGNRKVSLEISGWLNKSMLFWNDGIKKDVYIGIDNDAAESRFRFTGQAAISPDVTAGFVYEFGNHGAQSNLVNQTNGGDDAGFGPQRLRLANAWVESKRLGRVTLGLASQATDGIAEIDLSRSDVVAGSSVDTWIGGFVPVVGGAYDVGRVMYFHFLGNFDGGRDQLIRYDSPRLGGFILSGSYSGKFYPEDVPVTPGIVPVGPRKAEWDVALRYAAEWNSFRFATGIGYHEGEIVDGTGGPGVGGVGSVLDRLPYNKKVVGSSSLLHVPSGLFLTTAAGWMKNLDSYVFPEGDVIRYYYVKGGVLANLFPTIGQTTIYGEYYRMERVLDATNPIVWYPGLNAASQVYGVGVVQHIDGAAMELYAAYRYYDAPEGIDVQSGLREEYGSFHMGQVGMRIKF
jgi:hypothetical protein